MASVLMEIIMILLHGDIYWPTCSPGLSPLLFLPWIKLKIEVFKSRLHTSYKLKDAIYYEITTIQVTAIIKQKDKKKILLTTKMK